MVLEKYLAIAGLVLSIFFVAEIITIFNFMINPSESAEFGFDAAAKIFQFISLSVAPATILIGVSFVLSKRYGSKLNGILIIVSGIIILVGMIFSLEIFPTFVSQSLLFLSFLVATVGPAIVIIAYDSFKR